VYNSYKTYKMYLGTTVFYHILLCEGTSQNCWQTKNARGELLSPVYLKGSAQQREVCIYFFICILYCVLYAYA